MNAHTLLYRARTLADRSRRYSERHIKLFGAIAVFIVPATTLIEQAVGDPAFNTFFVRMAAAAVGLLLLFHDHLKGTLQRNFEVVWIGAITFILPVCYGALLTFNAALTPTNEVPSPIWVYQYLVALFIFIQLINHGPLSVALWLTATVGIFLAVLATVSDINLDALEEAWLYPLPVYLTALVIGSITNRNVHIVQAEQLRAASAIGGNIAHELRTPLASIRSLSRGIGRFLPDLVDSHRQAKEAGLNVSAITPSQLKELRAGLTSIQEEVNYSNTIIDMLLVNTLDRPSSWQEFQAFRISDAINEAIVRFPFNNTNERRMLRSELEDDFWVLGPRLLVVHVFFNLIKNGLYFVQKGNPGLLQLKTETRSAMNIVEITDSGIGIAPRIQSRIFDRFFTATNAGQGAGIGLSFCKMVMESLGGDIQCESQEGEYTTFRLIFPAVSDPQTLPENS